MNIEELKQKYGKIAIQICSKDRCTEVYGLLESLRHQSYDLFDIFLLDSGSQGILQNYYFIQYMIQRLKIEGHNVKLFRDEIAQGVSLSRQRLIDEALKDNYKYKLFCRIDDDSIADENMILKLVEGIENGYDLIGCIVPPFIGSPIVRETRFVEPIIGECRLNDKGELIMNFDDCGSLFIEEKILPSHHFRSSCIYKREIHEAGIDYHSRLSKNGFREEQIFSFKAILKGFKIGVHTGAICHHLQTPTGGERDSMSLVGFNQQIFDETVKRMWEDNGDFIHNYNVKYNLQEKEYTEEELTKSTNLITRK